MSQRPRSQLQVEFLEDRCTPSTSPFDFGSLFSQLQAKLSAAFPSLSLPSVPSLPTISLPSLAGLPSFPALPSLPSVPHVSIPTFPQPFAFPSFPQFPQFPNQFDSQLSDALQTARTTLEHLHSQFDALFNQLAEHLLDHFPS